MKSHVALGALLSLSLACAGQKAAADAGAGASQDGGGGLLVCDPRCGLVDAASATGNQTVCTAPGEICGGFNGDYLCCVPADSSINCVPAQCPGPCAVCPATCAGCP